ncbi:MAG: hypothetical protein UT14_C0053G0002 [Candidatus Shapirobacteria bacterium GW2011_GWE1_38_92]|uniref:Uncharacterized protein n=1 Tax=Candidatus Shapirobacteria bacterium GW2011_GWE1_38_92 TaxID=1618489 RepID=A0A0G0NV59_9BACT|nr:MAG: hypothetical protein UT14_C0053G0002 [Candidatus Shapirobacteria bacterium GW2011_GWE1_38_92]
MFGLDFLPYLVELGAVLFDLGDNKVLFFENKTTKNIEKTVGVGGDKINILTGNMEIWRDGFGYIFPPLLGGFGVIDPGTG